MATSSPTNFFQDDGTKKKSLPKEEEEKHDPSPKKNDDKNTTATAGRNSSSSSSSRLPIACHADERYPGMFRVVRARGKALSSGGFGVIIVDPPSDNDEEVEEENEEENEEEMEPWEQDSSSDDKPPSPKEDSFVKSAHENHPNSGHEMVDGDAIKDNETGSNHKSPNKRVARDYLFLEEVLFLNEQGLCDCFPHDPSSANGQNKNMTTSRPLSLPELYALLLEEEPSCPQLSLASYLVYAHLRQQTYRVLRYTPKRVSLLQQLLQHQQPQALYNSDKPPPQQRRRNLLLQYRHDVQQAPPPCVIGQDHDDDDDEKTTTKKRRNSSSSPLQFAYCVYPPDAKFAKSHPGMPAFLVAITTMSSSTCLTFSKIMELVHQAQGIPVQVATVADSGTVVMFGITDYGVPTLNATTSTTS
jgi:hypothetical protein